MERIKNLSWGLLILAVVTGVISYSSRFIHFNDKKPLIINYIKQVAGLESDIAGNISINILPPAITIANVSAYDSHKTLVLAAKEVRVNINPINLISGMDAIDMKNITIHKGDINLSPLIAHMRNSDIDANSLRIDSITLEKCQLSSDSDKDNKPIPSKTIKDLNATITHGVLMNANDLNIDSNMFINDIRYDFTGHFENVDNKGSSSNATLKLANSAVSFDFSGSLKNLFTSPELNGKINSQLSNIDNFKHIVNDHTLLQSFFKNNQLNFASDFSANSKMIKIDNITIASRDIQNLRGSVAIDFTYGVETDITLAIDKIDIDGIVKNLPPQQKDIQNTLEQALSYIVNNFDYTISDNLSATITVDIKEATLNNNKITDITGSADVFDGIVLINNGSANFPGEGKLSLDGKITHNKIRPRLDGKVFIQVSDFISFAKWANITDQRINTAPNLVMAMDLELIPHHLAMNNIRTALGNIKFVGKVIVHDDTNSNLSFTTSLRFNQLNFDDLQITKNTDELLYNLFTSDFDKTGEKFSEMTKDLRWLRTWNNPMSLEIIADKIIFKQQALDNAYISLDLTNNNLVINRVSINSDNIGFHGNLTMTMPLFRPYITGKITFDKLDVTKTSSLLPNFSLYRKNYQDSLIKQFAAGPAKDSIEEQNRKNALELSSYEFNFLSATNYDVDLDLAVNNIISTNNVSSFTCHINLLNGIIKIKDLISQAFGGSAEANASIVVVTPVPYFNIAFALINTQPGDLYKFITNHPKDMDGYLNASGQLSTRGVSSATLYDKLTGKIEVSAKRVSWPGFDLGKIIESVESSWEVADKMKAIKYYATYGGSTFDTIKSTITIADGIATTNNTTLQNDRVSAALAASCVLSSQMCNAASRYAFIPISRRDQILINMQSKGSIKQLQTDVDYDSIQKYLLSMVVKTNNTPVNDNSVESILRSRRGE